MHIVWPIISGILLLQLALGCVVAVLEHWSRSSSWYFVSITGLSIGYGDLVPHHAIARVLAVAIGILLIGLVVTLATRALQAVAVGGRHG